LRASAENVPGALDFALAWIFLNKEPPGDLMTPTEDLTTPLLKFIAEAKNKNGQATDCVLALQTLEGFPGHIVEILKKLDQIFALSLEGIRWKDTNRWIESWTSPYGKRIEHLSRTVGDTRDLLGGGVEQLVAGWNGRLRSLIEIETWGKKLQDRSVLCAFSSAVDATYNLEPGTSLEALLRHAANFITTTSPKDPLDAGPKAQTSPKVLLNASYQAYKDQRKDASAVNTVVEALAEIMWAYEHPEASLKPNLKGQAQEWIRALYLDFRGQQIREPIGGGASLNIADALAGLSVPTDVYWLYHPEMLAGTQLRCAGRGNSRLKRAEFVGRQWTWTQFEFDVPHPPDPVRMSVILSFSPNSPPIRIVDDAKALTDLIVPKGSGRLIFQFPDYMSPDYFSDRAAPARTLPKSNCFGRLEEEEAKEPVPVEAPEYAMKQIERIERKPHQLEKRYHRVILSGFQRDEASKDVLQRQCKGLRVHHEISATFDSSEAVAKYCEILSAVLTGAAARSAGINEEELAAFTSWHSSPIFSAAQAEVKDALLQRLFRAIRVREYFHLAWLYVHGNDIDIAVVDPATLPEDENKAAEYLKDLRDAMLIAKVTVFAALHVRSGVTTVEDRFGPSCSAKGLLALAQFAEEFALQFAPPDKDENVRKKNIRDLQMKIVMDGIVVHLPDAPVIVTVPVYWPDPAEGCSLTGGGDICSGVTAVFAP
jgi:hypothetical protein